MPEDHVDRRLAAILATDIAGYSRLMGTDEEGTLRQLKVHRKELVDEWSIHGGRCEHFAARFTGLPSVASRLLRTNHVHLASA